MCVVAFEACLRGKKIKVKGADFKEPIIKLLSERPEIAYIDPKTGKNPKLSINKFNDHEELLKYIKHNAKENQRYILQSNLKNGEELGHVVCMDIYNGNLRITDPQIGNESKTEEDAIKYLKLIDYDKNIGTLRIDNLNFTKGILDIIKE